MTERSPLCRHAEVREECPICKPFIEASKRRKENAIRLKRFTVMLDSNQAGAASEFFNGWVDTLGKQRAGDYFLVALRKADEALRMAIENGAARQTSED